MKKILIISLYGNYNFGNKLQSYALQTVVKNNGYDVQIAKIKYIYKDNFQNFRNICKQVLTLITLDKKSRLRKKKFIDFNNKYLDICNKYLFTNKSKNKIIQDYYKVIYGSDQIWNPTCFGDSDLFLGYCCEKARNISYAASFGISDIPEKLAHRYKQGINNFSSISVRELSGKNIVDSLMGENVSKVVMDPTMLLTREEWDLLLKKNKKTNNSRSYMLLYFLGSISEVINEQIVNYARKRNLQVINIMDKHGQYYINDPVDFLWFIKNAEVIFTDSFHACVFSITYEKNFIIFDREGCEKMNSRIDTLLEMVNMENARYSGIIDDSCFSSDYAKIREIIDTHRKKDIMYLLEQIARP